MENSIQYKESDVTKAIKLQFTDANAGRYLDPWWRTKRTENEISATGFCYMAAWAYHNIMGGDDAGLTVKKFIPQNKKGGHFWVVKQNKERLDLTEAQYPEGFDHYAEGEQSRKPSRLKKKVQEFAKLVREELDRQKLKINPSI